MPTQRRRQGRTALPAPMPPSEIVAECAHDTRYDDVTSEPFDPDQPAITDAERPVPRADDAALEPDALGVPNPVADARAFVARLGRRSLHLPVR